MSITEKREFIETFINKHSMDELSGIAYRYWQQLLKATETEEIDCLYNKLKAQLLFYKAIERWPV